MYRVEPQVAAEPAHLRTLVESLNSLGKANSLHVSLWGTQHEVDMPTLPKDHFAGPSLVHVIRTRLPRLAHAHVHVHVHVHVRL